MKVKKLDLQLNLRKKSCEETFAMKQQVSGVFIEGFANKATVDRGDEMIATDAWELDNFKRNPIILFNHGLDTLGGTPVGKATEIRQTEEGLYLKVKMSNSQAPGIKMVRELVEERILKAFSVGFNPKQTDTVDIDGKSVRKISKAELFEVSIVGVPMNQDSLFELSEKSLTTKSFHQLKGEILKAKGAKVALAIEDLLGACASRRDAMDMVAKSQKLTLPKLLDMLAGDIEIPAKVAEAFSAAVKAVDLKQTLEEALASLSEGATDDAVVESLMGKLNPSEEMEDEEAESKEEDKEDGEEDGEEEMPGDGKEESAVEDAGDEEAGGSEKEDDPDDVKRKADFQDCVNAAVPKLIEEGMEQDQAVAAAIAKCQQSGKCQLTPNSKSKVFAEVFAALDTKSAPVLGLAGIEFKTSEEEQVNQAPTTPVKTEDSPENFGSPFLEAAKQTNVLLGALINEIQKLSSKMDSITAQSSVPLEEDTTAKGQEESSETQGVKTFVEDHAAKRLDSLNKRLKNLGF